MLKFPLYGQKMNIGKDLKVIFLGEINNKYPKSKRLQFIKRTNWVLPHIVWRTPISGSPIFFYTDANKSGKAGYTSENLSKVALAILFKSQNYMLFSWYY